ncbi:MAG: oligopeptide/dipeptide ABC transporter ATP-binding protein [Chloroflexota bacterium]
MEQANLPLIEARDITKHFVIRPGVLARLLARLKDTVVHAVDGVSLKIWTGETVGLVGESGCGKTTFGRVVSRIYEPTSGEILFKGSSLRESGPAVSGDKPGPLARLGFYRVAQVIFQNPYSSLNPRKTVREIVAVPLQSRGLKGVHEQEEIIVALLQRVGLSPRHLDQYPHQFSGGQRQRIGIARALAMRPQFIVADEPVSSLDVSIQAQVINLLEELQEEFHLTYLFIAHDLSLIHHISDRVVVMYLGRIAEEGPTNMLFSEPQHPYTQALLAAIPSADKGGRRPRIILKGTVPSPINPPSGCRFHPRCFAHIGPICEHESPPFFQVGQQRVACWRCRSEPVVS